MSRPHAHHDAPLCPACTTGPLTTAASHPRAGEISASLICAACGAQHDGTAEEIAQAVKSEAAWERLQAREEAEAARANKVLRAGGVVAVKVRRAPVKVEQGALFASGGAKR